MERGTGHTWHRHPLWVPLARRGGGTSQRGRGARVHGGRATGWMRPCARPPAAAARAGVSGVGGDPSTPRGRAADGGRDSALWRASGGGGGGLIMNERMDIPSGGPPEGAHRGSDNERTNGHPSGGPPEGGSWGGNERTNGHPSGGPPEGGSWGDNETNE